MARQLTQFIVATVAVLAFAGVLCAADAPSRATAPTTQPNHTIANDPVLQAIQLDAIMLHDAVDSMRPNDVSIFVDWNTLARAGVDRELPVSVDLPHPHLSEALDALLKDKALAGKDLAWTVDPEKVICISTRAGLARMAQRRPGIDQLKKDLPAAGKVVEVNAGALLMSDVIDYLRDSTRAKISVDWNKLKQAGINETTPVALLARDVSLAEAIDLVMTSVLSDEFEPVISVEQGVLVISAGPRLAGGTSKP